MQFLDDPRAGESTEQVWEKKEDFRNKEESKNLENIVYDITTWNANSLANP